MPEEPIFMKLVLSGGIPPTFPRQWLRCISCKHNRSQRLQCKDQINFNPPLTYTDASLHVVIRNGLVNTFTQQWIDATTELLDTSFSVWPVLSKKSLWACLCTFLLLLGKNFVEMFSQQWRIVGGNVFYMIHVVSKGSRTLVLPKPSCFNVKDSVTGIRTCFILHVFLFLNIVKTFPASLLIFFVIFCKF
jgi:hypothetical protein